MDYKYIGIDTGGTRLEIFEIDPINGSILDDVLGGREYKMSVINSDEELNKIIIPLIKKRGDPKKVKIGACSAGIIDYENLEVIDSPNSKIEGKITYARVLRELKYKITLANDLEASAMGQARWGHGKNIDNVVTATFSSGFNIGKTYKGFLVNGIHYELGHQDYEHNSQYVCGCGGKGHLEIFVSGNGAAQMAKKYFREKISELKSPIEESHPILEFSFNDLIKNSLDHTPMKEEIIENITAQHIYKAYRKNPEQEPQSWIRKKQVEAIAYAFGRIVAAANPVDRLICMGSQAEKDGDLLIEPAKELFYENPDKKYRFDSLQIPEIVINKISNIGAIGAVAYYLSYSLKFNNAKKI